MQTISYNYYAATSSSSVLQPSSISENKNTTWVPIPTNNPNTSSVTKPLQSGDLESSLNKLVDHLNIHDHTKIG